MQTIVSQVSNEIIVSHMNQGEFNRDKYLSTSDYKIAFYDKNREFLFGTLNEKLDEKLGFDFNFDKLSFVDNSTVGHLGIWYIALEDFSFSSKLDSLKYQIAFIFLIVYSIISIVGIYLAKLFLKPIKDERERLNNFIKDTTHELNTPISAIIMSSSSENLSSKQLERIKFSANRVSEIYKDLTFLFLEDKIEKKLENLELSKIIKEQIDSFEPIFLRKKLTISLDLDEFFYELNKDDFIRLFNNLFSNAVKYNNIGGFVEVELKNRVLSIKDSGIGIEKSKLDDIFKRFFRATKQSGGFGLGLNIVDKICKEYNLKIELFSIENSGTTFKISF